ncbi:glycosyltransferase family 2 protein [Bacillus sp. BRMEA1]|uniref:glycosyltransferase family 2 protein n=1 Tax=Neobacillus endophyticus TaxID=2738405 RepID=UPI001566BC12|nr:glycosyltransferase family 2 protein [Neobacillus endophyticus]NRD76695.1 glycosyltransferase family 2 protein [Neobacillus endophyticus]
MISVIVPCYNEEKSIRNFHREITEVMKSQATYELVFVDDGSRDDTLKLLQEISYKDEAVRYLSFSRNFGKEAAMLAGLTYASGDAVIIMDADLQHPPSLIPEMIQRYYDGYDQVIAKRNRKGDALIRTGFSKLYYKLMNKMVDVKLVDGVGDFRLLSRRAVDALLAMNEYNRFSKGLFSWIGFDEYVIEYENVAREEGASKWSMPKLINYGIDGIISFNNKPLRLSIYFGLIITLLDLLYIFIIFLRILIYGVEVPGYFTIIASVMLLGGIQLIFLGVIGEYIGRIYYESKRRPHFIVKNTNIESAEAAANPVYIKQQSRV